MFSKILIANRGEIACRVAATARRLGIRTVAVYSDADATAAHVAACDEAYRLGPAPARESYLRADAILEVARRSGAQAIHPGYGFLSENEAFAQACAEAGVVFIGPPPSAIRAMGLKAESKRLMSSAGVPLVPGYHDADQDPALLAREAARIGYPVLIKASAGGGGKGMRVVNRAEEFEAALASCKREAQASFGDDAVLIERYLQRPRHIEIQVFADTHGQCVYLFERDCSVQRRHQKVIEEAPAPGMTEARRQAMGEAAVAAARAVGYVGAGTVEFIAEPDGRFYFMEMNTRLQVEHPVTEMITGIDLVQWQLRVAAGEPLPLSQAALQVRGHAIEARIYAENPERGFLPSTGPITHLRMPQAVHFTHAAGATDEAAPAGTLVASASVRIDGGVREGDVITPHYDPMIAKLIVWGTDRAQAIDRMTQALAAIEVVGPSTNVDFLGRLMRCASFAQADLDTGLIERERAALLEVDATPSSDRLALAAAAVLANEQAQAATVHDAHDPWSLRGGWRLGVPLIRKLVFGTAHGPEEVCVEYAREGYALTGPRGLSSCLARLSLQGSRLSGLVGERSFCVSAVFSGETLHLFDADGHLSLHYSPALAHAGEGNEEGGRLTAPMPGKVISVLVGAGQKVSRGEALVVMEAMKMEHTIAAPGDGTVTELLYGVGDQVPEGAQLIGFSPA
jgi:3-methylcrotonyl-CoA carboxylase alpha subunit